MKQFDKYIIYFRFKDLILYLKRIYSKLFFSFFIATKAYHLASSRSVQKINPMIYFFLLGKILVRAINNQGGNHDSRN